MPPAPTASGSSGTAAQLLLTPRSGAEAAGRRLLLQLCLVCGVLWAGALACASLVQPVSRRLCNLSYVLWAAAHNVMMLALLVGVDLLASIPATTQVMGAIFQPILLIRTGRSHRWQSLRVAPRHVVTTHPSCSFASLCRC